MASSVVVGSPQQQSGWSGSLQTLETLFGASAGPSAHGGAERSRQKAFQQPSGLSMLNKKAEEAPDGSPPDAVLRSWQYQVTRNAAAAAALQELKVEHIKHGGTASLEVVAQRHISASHLEDTFYIVDLGNVLRMFRAWKAAMPRVTPYYAVKCNPEPGILKLLAAMGAGFDCASKGELETILSMGVDPSRIIFAHPTKRASDIRYARAHGVAYTTFDTVSELHKIAALNPDFKCVLRIRADDPDARVPLGLKYGAEVSEGPTLLAAARQLGLSVVGVSFHVGSACANLAAYSDAIAAAGRIFDAAQRMGFRMELLDIGRGVVCHFNVW